MPLPAALLARLKQRGIIPNTRNDEIDQRKEKESGAEHEEVFAESYDTKPNHDEDREIGPQLPSDTSGSDVRDTSGPAAGCPNKWNVYHKCRPFCHKRWGSGTVKEPRSLTLKRSRMLKKYPVPPEWAEEYDPGTGRYYYWHKDGKQVSWLSPNHPRSQVTLPVPKFQEIMAIEEDHEDDFENDDEDDSGDSDDDEADEEKFLPQKKAFRQVSRRAGPRYSSDRRKNRRDDGALDPMDPAAYSDTCPRGGWADGLDREGEKAVDSTASGPLFQQRPYPSPGDVLRMKKK